MRIIIAGGGLGGLSLALALRQSLGRNYEIVLADPALARSLRADTRAYAISAAGRRMFAALGVWDAMQGGAEPITDMLVTDSKTRDVVRPGYLTFAHPSAGGDDERAQPFAHMVWSRVINDVLTGACRAAGVLLRPDTVRAVETGPDASVVTYGSGDQHRACLVVAADGARSRLRESAAIGWVGWDYGQSGIVATVAHERPHGGRAIEHFLPAGPFAVLPLPDDPANGHQSSIVWTEATGDAETLLSLHQDDLLGELESRFGLQLGELRFASTPKAYPLSFGIARRFVVERLALLGDAAHVIHPIAGQGLNLGLKDAASLAETIVDAARLGLDVGLESALAPYQAARRFDTVAMGVVTDGLNRLFSNDLTPVRLARDLGLGLVDRMPGLKAMFISEASGNSSSQPRLLRGEAV